MIKYPLRQAKLPTAETLLPYLREIDKKQWYSNFGGSLISFENKLAKTFSVQPDQIACTVNGTAALLLSLLASNPKPSSYCLLPAFTFVGSAAAVNAAGLNPWFIDVSLDTWSITPEHVYAVMKKNPNKISSVMVVSPYGQPMDVSTWQSFSEKTGITVVFDGAWCFGSVAPSELPFIVSLHATKVFGIGEGGVVISKNTKLISTIKQSTNFGMNQDKIAMLASANYKMSEYHAAVGLAMLAQWPEINEKAKQLAKWYISALSDKPGIQLLPLFNGKWAPATIPLQFDQPITFIQKELLKKGIESRAWWGTPCHLHPAYQHYPSETLTNTNQLASSVLNLPFSTTMTELDVETICDHLITAYHLSKSHFSKNKIECS
jgi:dTDP-4-amino-4,6-dideoxygalactose transaminase